MIHLLAGPAIHVAKVRCQECSKEKLPGEVIIAGDTTRCFDCMVLHRKRLADFLAADYVNCTVCGVKLFTPRNLRGHMTIIDGSYGLLCRSCRDWYRPLRRDLYGETSIGRHLKM